MTSRGKCFWYVLLKKNSQIKLSVLCFLFTSMQHVSAVHKELKRWNYCIWITEIEIVYISKLSFKVESISFMRKLLYKIKSCVPSDPLVLFSNRYLKTGLPNLLASKNFLAFLLRKIPSTHPRSTDSKSPEEVPRNSYF